MADRDPPPSDRVLLVEGQDDKHVVLHFCMRNKIGMRNESMLAFDISDKDGIDPLLDSISPEIKVSGRKSVGILVDANDEPANRWQSIGSRLQQFDLHLPEAPGPNGTVLSAVSPAVPRIGIWLWPDNQCPGELEDFVKTMIPSKDPVWPRSEAYIDCIPGSDRKFLQGKEVKAKIYAWLATTETPGRMGTAIKARLLDVDGPLALKFADWLRRLFA